MPREYLRRAGRPPAAGRRAQAESDRGPSARKSRRPRLAKSEEVKLLLTAACSGCRRGGSGLRVWVGRRRGARAVRENEAVAVVEQFLEVLGPVQLESLPVGFEGLELGAGEAVQGGVVLDDPPEDVRQ